MNNKTPINITNQSFSEEYKELHIRPWCRFFAKIIDLLTASFLIWILIWLLVFIFIIIIVPVTGNFLYQSQTLYYIAQYGLLVDILFTMFIVLFWTLIEPFILILFGTTLGRYLFSIQLTNLNGKKLSLREAYQRSFKVYLKGLAAGIPILSYITMYMEDTNLTKKGATSWDENTFIVTHGKPSFIKKTFIVLILGGALFLEFSDRVTSAKIETSAQKENVQLSQMLDDISGMRGGIFVFNFFPTVTVREKIPRY